MRKVILVVIGTLCIALATVSNCFALVTATKTFTLSATVPGATGISITAYNVDTATGNATLVSGLSLGYDPLTFDPVNNIWKADHYFYINVQATGGPGTPTTTLTYAEGANPNGTGHGLGWKGNLSYNKVSSTGAVTPLAAHPTENFKDVNGDIVLASELAGGFYFRGYLGLNTGAMGGFEPFTNADAAGVYDGTLLVSATMP